MPTYGIGLLDDPAARDRINRKLSTKPPKLKWWRVLALTGGIVAAYAIAYAHGYSDSTERLLLKPAPVLERSS